MISYAIVVNQTLFTLPGIAIATVVLNPLLCFCVPSPSLISSGRVLVATPLESHSSSSLFPVPSSTCVPPFWLFSCPIVSAVLRSPLRPFPPRHSHTAPHPAEVVPLRPPVVVLPRVRYPIPRRHPDQR